MKRIFLMLQICLCFTGFAQTRYNQTDVVDLALIYHGGVHRDSYRWTKEQFEPFVSYQDAQGKRHWQFDGFLFLEFKDGKGKNFAPGYDKLNAAKQDWNWLLGRHFEKDIAFDALDQVIAGKKKEIKKPSFKHKIIMGLPSPILNQKDWGELDGRALDFSVKQDRLSAIEWYIDTFLSTFSQQDYKNLQVAGFYWVDEDDRDGKGITKEVGDYIRSKGFKFYWIPYWNASGGTKWSEMGFDFAWQQPNHFFNSKIEDSRLQEACELADKFGMGMEMEFDDDALVNAPKNKRDRLEAYINAFERNGVFEYSSVAYYQGGSAFYKLSKSAEVKDKQMYQRLADLLAKRKEKSVYKKLLKK